jgi:hypothetical protein
VLFENADTQDGLYDLYLASTLTPGPPITLLATPTGYPTGFTTDSSHLLYMTDVSTTTYVGALYSLPVAPSGVPVLLASAATGFPSRVGPTGMLFTDNGSGSGSPPPLADLEWVDVAQGASPTRIASEVHASGGGYSNAYFFFSEAVHGVVYVASLPSGASGLYVAPLL